MLDNINRDFYAMHVRSAQMTWASLYYFILYKLFLSDINLLLGYKIMLYSFITDSFI